VLRNSGKRFDADFAGLEIGDRVVISVCTPFTRPNTRKITGDVISKNERILAIRNIKGLEVHMTIDGSIFTKQEGEDCLHALEPISVLGIQLDTITKIKKIMNE
jgi:hypothetical protein